MRPLILCTLVAAAVLAPAQTDQLLGITNVTVVDTRGGPSRVATVVVRGDRIESVGSGAPPSGARVVDGRGKFLIPGLWDMHVHLATRPEPELAERMILPALLAHGIVGVRDMGGPLARTLELRTRVASGELAGPRILTPGPFLDGAGDESPLFNRVTTVEAAKPAVAALKTAGVNFVKIQAGLDAAAHRAIVAAAREQGLEVAGHIPLAMTAQEVAASGQRTIEHVSPALVGDGLLLFACSSRASELIAELRSIEADRPKADAATIARREAALRARAVETYDPAVARALGASLKGKNVWILPTLIWSNTLRPVSRAEDGSALPMDLVPAALRTRWMERRKAFIGRSTDESFAASADLARTAGRAVRDLHAGGARILAGTDSFDAFVLPGYSLHQELRLLVEAGLTPLQAIQAATSEAAAARAAANEGAIAPGMRADLLLLNADPTADIANVSKIDATILNGKLIDRAGLDQLLAGVRAFSAK